MNLHIHISKFPNVIVKIDGGEGNDFLFGGSDNDVFKGGPGEDFFDCNEGIDRVIDFDPNEDTANVDCEVLE